MRRAMELYLNYISCKVRVTQATSWQALLLIWRPEDRVVRARLGKDSCFPREKRNRAKRTRIEVISLANHAFNWMCGQDKAQESPASQRQGGTSSGAPRCISDMASVPTSPPSEEKSTKDMRRTSQTPRRHPAASDNNTRS